MVRQDARIKVAEDLSVLEATEDALTLLGMSLEELRRLPPGALTPEGDATASADLRAAWENDGRGPVVGATTLRLPDGKLLRLRYYVQVQPDRTFEFLLERSAEEVEAPSRAYTVSAVLSAWRAAERRLAAVEPGSDEWAAVSAEVEHFRRTYQQVARPQKPTTA